MNKSGRLKILQVCSADDVGGGELHVADLSRALIERGHELHLAARPRSALAQLLAKDHIELHEIALRNAADVGSALQLARLIRTTKMDVMHAHVARDYPVCGVAARLGGTAFLLTRHHFRSFPKSRAYQWAINPASALIAVSGSIANGISTAFPKIADRVVVIPNWVDVERRDYVSREEARHRLGLTRPLTVAVAGQLSPLKQQHVFIEACAQLDKSILAGINVLLAGTAAPGDEPYAEGIKSLVRESGLSETVLMPGFVPDFPKLLAAIDLVVVPSANEGFSLVVIEAMAAGVAVVASSVGGPSEIIDDAVSGVLVPPGDAAALRASMSELLTNHARRLEIGHAGREVARSRFARERVIDRIEALYRQVI